MPAAPIPPNEAERLTALQALDVLDTPPEPEFDALVQAAALVCGVPISLVSLIDADRQWFKANAGLPGVAETPREIAFCAHAILQDGVFEVNDAVADERFADNPAVTGAPDIRFYAGAPLKLKDGSQVGTLCVIDRQPRHLTPTQREVLRHLAAAAVAALESRRMARGFAASEARFRALSEAAPLGVFAADAEGACTYTNARWQAIYGLDGEQALGHGWLHAVHPDDRDAVVAQGQHAAAQGRDFDMEFRVRHADGSVRHVRAVSRPVIDADGTVSGHVGSAEDVTERLRTQRALQHEQHRLASILEGTGAATWEWNLQTDELRLNDRWAAMLGLGLDELSPATLRTWVERIHPGDVARVSARLEQHLAGEAPDHEYEGRLRHRDGHWIWVYGRGQVLTRTPDGRPEWMFGTHLDISVRKAQEQALHKSQQFLIRTGELAQVGGWELDLATGGLVWSDQTYRIHNLPIGQTPGLEEAIHFYAPEARPVIQAAVERAMVDGQGYDLELAFIQAGGQRIWVRVVGNAGFEDGRPVRLIGAFQDITERVLQRQAIEGAHERMRLATDSGGIGVWDYDIDAGTLVWDAWMYRLYGLPPADGLQPYDLWARHLHPRDRARAEQDLRDAVAQGRDGYDSEFRIVRGDGSVHHLRAAARIRRDAEGRAVRMVGVNWDITLLRRLADELAEQHELLRITLHSIGDAVITADATGRVTWLNPTAERMTGWTRTEALGLALGQVFRTIGEESRQPVDSPDAETAWHGLDAAGATPSSLAALTGIAELSEPAEPLVLIARDGKEYGIEPSAAPIRDAHGDVLGQVVVFRDVTEQRRLTGEMSWRATHDALTGLVNRAEFESRLRRALQRSHADGTRHSLMCIDLDQFKLVNDACGHSAGDQLLQQVAKLMGETVRARDTVARMGGDEFAVLLEYCTSEQAQRVAQQICDRVDAFRFVHDDRRFRVGTSIGLVPLDSRWDSAAAALKTADTSCYAAKEAGRNRVHVWLDTDLAVRARHGEMQWATRLEQALDEGRFTLYAQRIEALDGSPGLHAEVLLRLVEADGSLVAPGAFLPAAERFHLATRIDRWVLRHALAQLAAQPEPSAVGMLCVNLSGQSIGDRSFHRQAIEMLGAMPAEVCGSLCLEITETAAITNMADAALFIGQARALGVRIALDDFGAGASSFGYLKTLAVDVLKIDGQFVRDLIDDPLDDAAVRCFVDVARVMGLKTVAECVERPEVLQRVREMGIDHAQGWLLHRPEPIEWVLGAPGQARRALEAAGSTRGALT